MLGVRLLAIGLSSGLHAAALASVLWHERGRAFESGSEIAAFRVERGAVEVIAAPGRDLVTVTASEAEPLSPSQARPAGEPVAAREAPPDAEAVRDPGPEAVLAESITSPSDLRHELPPPEAARPVEAQLAAPVQPETPPAAPERKSAGGAAAGGEATLRAAYLGSLRAKIEKATVKPRSRASGTTIVRFTVDAAGHVVSREIAASSGDKVLDEAALAAVARALPLPPFPEGLARDPLVVSIPFKFVR
jgi:periplasmic protein TonB